ncbi:5-methylcytosine restriction system specificity protein McrC [Virgibacillus sp. L01]|uniref:5-methylcytosine restriction system specificity protein McrC n=1 Tax=Virgibacillus sp. L01 TaxID=3457429 RepID=UPI003FD12E8F
MKRISVIEYGAPKPVIEQIMQDTDLSREDLIQMINKAGDRVKRILGYSKNPINIGDDKIRITDFAGILRIGPSIEIEVAPKFLGLDSINHRWREDFFYLATLSTSGKLLNSDKLLSKPGEKGDLHTLIARAFVEMYWDNHRRSLRTYSRRTFKDFSIDGDVDPESLFFPDGEGYKQEGLFFDHMNQYNSVIVTAAKQLLPSLREPNLIAQIQRVIQLLTPQKKLNYINVRSNKLPNRLSRWQQLYNLSLDILKGYGLVYHSKNSIAPGYVLNTWKVWEDFLSSAIISGFGMENVKRQNAFVLGERQRSSGVTENVNVIPDLLISNGGQEGFIFDAKYKGHVEKGRKRIVEQDIYESLAFLYASGHRVVLLAYPVAPQEGYSLGDINVFEKIEVGNKIILGLEVESKTVSSKHGFLNFSNNLYNNCNAVIKNYT